MAAMSESPAALIGARIQEERTKKGLTLKALSGRVGLSISYLSQIENGHVNLNVENLHQISKALGVPIINLLVSETRSDVSISRRGERRWMPLGEKAAESLLVKYRGNFEIFVIKLEPHATTQALTHEGEEFTYVVSGRVRIFLGSDEYHDLEEGDVAYYRSTLPHHWENTTNTAAEMLVVNSPATY